MAAARTSKKAPKGSTAVSRINAAAQKCVETASALAGVDMELQVLLMPGNSLTVGQHKKLTRAAAAAEKAHDRSVKEFNALLGQVKCFIPKQTSKAKGKAKKVPSRKK